MEALARFADEVPQRPAEALAGDVDVLARPAPVARQDLRRLGRRVGPIVGDEVGDAGVDLVADAGDPGDLRPPDRAGDDFLVKAPEVFERAAAANEQEHVYAPDGSLPGVQRLDAAGNPGPRPVPLHGHA